MARSWFACILLAALAPLASAHWDYPVAVTVTPSWSTSQAATDACSDDDAEGGAAPQQHLHGGANPRVTLVVSNLNWRATTDPGTCHLRTVSNGRLVAFEAGELRVLWEASSVLSVSAQTVTAATVACDAWTTVAGVQVMLPVTQTMGVGAASCSFEVPAVPLQQVHFSFSAQVDPQAAGSATTMPDPVEIYFLVEHELQAPHTQQYIYSI